MTIEENNELARKTREATLYLNDLRRISKLGRNKGSVLKIRINALKKKHPDKYIWLYRVFNAEKEINQILRSY